MDDSSSSSSSSDDSSSSRSSYTSFDFDKCNDEPNMSDLIDKALRELEISRDEQQRLSKLCILITWEVPLLHRHSTQLMGTEKYEKITEYLAKRCLVFQLKKIYTAKEWSIIEQNWEEFSRIYGFENPDTFFPSRDVQRYFSKEERHKFRLFLARNLPVRLLWSVQYQFEKIYSTFNRRRYSADEDHILRTAWNYDVKDHGVSRCRLMCKILGRNMFSVTRRLKCLLKGDIRGQTWIYVSEKNQVT